MKGPSVEILPGTVNNGMMQEPDFSEYMWMGEELDEFDQKVCNIVGTIEEYYMRSTNTMQVVQL